jgi:hypothetical protein
MSLRRRLKRLEESTAVVSCPACANRRVDFFQEYELPNGETITLPPIPDPPPCTCRQPSKEPKIVALVIRDPNTVQNREEAERRYAKFAAFHRPWQRGDDTN